MKTKLQKVKYWASVSVVGIVLGVGLQFVKAWVEPVSAPPASNIAVPLSASNIGQSKGGGLILNTSGAANGLIVQNGNVGIGTTAPAAKLDIAGGDVRIGSNRTIFANGRMHISGDEKLVLLNRDGVTISKAWGGDGSLTVEGALNINGNMGVVYGGTVYTPQPANAGEDTYTAGGGVTCYSDTCNGDSANSYTCGANETKSCVDEWGCFGPEGPNPMGAINVTCKKGLALMQN